MRKIVFWLLLGVATLLKADWNDKITINGYFNFEFEDRVAG